LPLKALADGSATLTSRAKACLKPSFEVHWFGFFREPGQLATFSASDGLTQGAHEAT
jgi:hypothetical protein